MRAGEGGVEVELCGGGAGNDGVATERCLGAARGRGVGTVVRLLKEGFLEEAVEGEEERLLRGTEGPDDLLRVTS